MTYRVHTQSRSTTWTSVPCHPKLLFHARRCRAYAGKQAITGAVPFPKTNDYSKHTSVLLMFTQKTETGATVVAAPLCFNPSATRTRYWYGLSRAATNNNDSNVHEKTASGASCPLLPQSIRHRHTGWDVECVHEDSNSRTRA